MSRARQSLLAGRNKAALNEDEARRASNIFLFLDDGVAVRHDPSQPTRFHVTIDDGHEVGEITFGADIFPGTSVVDPNAMLSALAAAAHELTHYYRWHDKSELPQGPLDPLDEALTSLQAILRYEPKLKAPDIRGLVSDAVQRIMLYIDALPAAAQAQRVEPVATPPLEPTEPTASPRKEHSRARRRGTAREHAMRCQTQRTRPHIAKPAASSTCEIA